MCVDATIHPPTHQTPYAPPDVRTWQVVPGSGWQEMSLHTQRLSATSTPDAPACCACRTCLFFVLFGGVGGWVGRSIIVVHPTNHHQPTNLGYEGAVPAVDHQNVGRLPLGHLLRGRGRAHARGVGVVEPLGDGPAVDRDAEERLLVGVALRPEEVAGDLDC